MEIKNLLDNSKKYLKNKDKSYALELLNTAKDAEIFENDKELWSDFLNITYEPDYLELLPDSEVRNEWAELVLKIIRNTNFNLLDMFKQRTSKHPEKILFRQIIDNNHYNWTYEKIYSYTNEIAAAIIAMTEKTPKVAIFSENSVQSASVDLACLFYDILVTPLNINFNISEVESIIERLQINLVFTDTEDRYKKLVDLRNESSLDFRIICSKTDFTKDEKDIFLGAYLRSLSGEDIENIIEHRPRLKINEVATVMFTSGSTGKPKGISFSIYNLIAKRYCRGAALEHVGRDEVLLCYLPLFHTFGRFLEMLGTIYWNGTYVFTGNSSPETLMKLFRDIEPSVFISVPLRWMQLEEEAMKNINLVTEEDDKKIAFRKATGNNLHWGLSAAGYLDPKTFRFFRKNGVELCSGFGMTEGTGGITMTPPGEYFDDSVGKPLPGIYLKLAEHNELQINGHYVARYLDDKAPGDIIPYPEDDDYWLPTGDVFEQMDNGHYKIVDRLKDIYKNNKGQTIAPRNVENKFTGVPGIKSTFLVGDGKPYNVLFIIPDKNEKILFNESKQTIAEYYNQIVRAANDELPSYERVINYAILDRDFSLEKGELTPKGSFNRKKITENFKEEIDKLYISNNIILQSSDIKVSLPRWFFRDLSILENDLVFEDNYLINKVLDKKLKITKSDKNEVKGYNSYVIGNFEYKIMGNSIDLGRLIRLPYLWLGNTELMNFAKYKYGWDTSFDKFYNHIFLPENYKIDIFPKLERNKDALLSDIYRLTVDLLSKDDTVVISALEKLGHLLSTSDERTSHLIRSRIEMMARHNNESIRATAYRILLLDEPNPDYTHAFPAFLASGKKFINTESIHQIATGKLEKRRLEALRKRLLTYREQLSWPSNEITQSLFEDIFDLLIEFIKVHPEYYTSVRYELTNWMLHKKDPALAEIAKKYFQKLYSYYEYRLDSQIKSVDNDLWESKLVFDDSLKPTEISNIKSVIIGTAFIKQSILLAFDEKGFEITDVKDDGIWVSRLESASSCKNYRVSINTKQTSHFEFQIFINDNIDNEKALEGIFWHIIISGYPYGPRVIPRLGAVRPELNARSVEYLNELTAWDKIRSYASERIKGENFSKTDELQTLFVESLTAFFRAWIYTYKQIVPGHLTPENVMVPELDFRETATINAIAGWTMYENELSLIKPIIKNFYEKTTHHYSWIFDQINLKWIFDSLIEATGIEKATIFINNLENILQDDLKYKYRDKLLNSINEYRKYLKIGYYEPLALIKAIKRYIDWEESNPDTSDLAKEETLKEISNLYRLSRYPEIIRYAYYRDTYFRNSDPTIKNAINELIHKMIENDITPAINLIELSRLQSKLTKETDRHVFSRMVYPSIQSDKDIDVLTNTSSQSKKVILQSHFRDKFGIIYNFRQPKNPSEIGLLYRIFFKEKYPKLISDKDEYFVITDSIDRVIGGICYKSISENEIFLDGSVVISTMKGRGIGKAMLTDFIGRMSMLEVQMIKTHYFMKNFYSKFGFNPDKSRGALVKYIKPESSENIQGEYCKIIL